MPRRKWGRISRARTEVPQRSSWLQVTAECAMLRAVNSGTQRRLRLFICYSAEDADLKDHLVKHLRVLKRFRDDVELWSDEQIQPGADWRKDVEVALDQTDVALVLISVSLLNSDFLVDVEIARMF